MITRLISWVINIVFHRKPYYFVWFTLTIWFKIKRFFPCGKEFDIMKLCSEDGVEKPSLEHQCHLYSCVSVAGIVVHKRPATIMRVSHTLVLESLFFVFNIRWRKVDLPVGYEVGGENSLGLHHQVVRGELQHWGLQKPDNEVDSANLDLHIWSLSIFSLPSSSKDTDCLPKAVETCVSNG